MKFASEKSSSADGRLLLVAKDMSRAIAVPDIADTLQQALNNWAEAEPLLQARYAALNDGQLSDAQPLSSFNLDAPMPRSWQWLDGSCFLNHGHLMQKAFHLDPIEDADKYPLVYQGAGDNFSAPTDPLVMPNAEVGADFEGEFGVIIDKLPMGATAQQAYDAIRLVVLLNDISYRALAPREMKTGFGFVQAKGATAFAPVAVTPDELGDAWHNGRVQLPVHIERSGEWFGNPNGAEMHFGFQDVIAHVTQTRALNAGTVVGSGTVSNADPTVGQACIAEIRAKELIKHGAPQTPFLSDGETVVMQALDNAGNSVFGAISQTVTLEVQ
ncbi:fumarylacetoacetate hydrolase family protein [Alteromonas lipolytica]|uniref:Fumarylacetoacetate hydrolase n=1 Tax=Alteromonas lipolytica TaxID=1856405 RepID=A0A1E8F9U6_9ALTE|nr:fumarylacetoacetate hydrolase family protein [Alteromonas lipolytica]OFI32313.1 fumarylacetoacetate hydrolase [Alteromonas lipolytica]GGF85558.1 2-keto-4-pentenoate hydratase [Alteromonas lipolytica]